MHERISWNKPNNVILAIYPKASNNYLRHCREQKQREQQIDNNNPDNVESIKMMKKGKEKDKTTPSVVLHFDWPPPTQMK